VGKRKKQHITSSIGVLPGCYKDMYSILGSYLLEVENLKKVELLTVLQFARTLKRFL